MVYVREEKMQHQTELRKGVLVCGALERAPGCICLREVGHWGPHVVLEPTLGYFLVQTECTPISFRITDAIARIAQNDKDWAWSD